MSQSDYLKFKRISTELKVGKLDPIFNPEDYLSYKEFSLENSIQNTKLTYNQLLLPNRTKIFNMEKMVNSCPSFNACKNTNLRTNRKLMLSSQINPTPSRPLNEKKIQKKLVNMNFCMCSKI
jgi:hypothetical protein